MLSKAVVRAASHLTISNSVLARVLGLSEASISRMSDGRFLVQRGSKPFELALMFVRLFRSLDALTGGDDTASRSWLHTENKALGAKPIDLIQRVDGLTWTTAYVDAARGVV